MAGRGFGKTRTGVEDALTYCMFNDNVRYGVVAPTQSDLRKVCFEGDSGLIANCPQELIKGGDWNKNMYELELWNGSLIQGFSADQPNRLRGPQFHRGWCDEISSWRYPDAWDMLEFGMRLGKNPQTIITSTPKPVPLVKMLVKQKGVIITLGSTFENEKNLAARFLERVKNKYEGTKLGAQELYGMLLEDFEGSLWKRGMIKYAKHDALPPMLRIVVAVDPAVTAHEDSDETGIIVVGYGADGNFYVLDDITGTYKPNEWATKVVKAFEQWEADCVVAEVNNGGDLVESVIRNVDKFISYKQVRASRGKVVRAEPIAQLYEKGKVFHVGVLSSLEDQMCSFDPLHMEKSPDRVDALVWGLTELTAETDIVRLRQL